MKPSPDSSPPSEPTSPVSKPERSEQASLSPAQNATSSQNATGGEMDIDQAIADLESGVVALRQRYSDVAQARREKQELRVRLNRAQSELRQHRTKQLEKELKSLQGRLEEIELTLESQLFSWSGIKEPFWQAIRFGGIGMILGWVLKSLTSS